jgi:hypothetical protein
MARPGLRNHPKFRRLRKILGMPAVYVEAHLEAMWKVGYENGDPLIGDADDVELAAEWEDSQRPAGDFFKAALESRWIDPVDEGRFQIHDLLDHAPDYVKKRAQRHLARKNKDLRPKTADNGGQRNPSPDWQDENVRTPAPAPAPTPQRGMLRIPPRGRRVRRRPGWPARRLRLTRCSPASPEGSPATKRGC